jgi:hypothetical protein
MIRYRENSLTTRAQSFLGDILCCVKKNHQKIKNTHLCQKGIGPFNLKIKIVIGPCILLHGRLFELIKKGRFFASFSLTKFFPPNT